MNDYQEQFEELRQRYENLAGRPIADESMSQDLLFVFADFLDRIETIKKEAGVPLSHTQILIESGINPLK